MDERRIFTAIALAVLLVTVAVSGVTAHGGDDGAHHHDGWMGAHDGMGWGMGWGLWFLWPLVVLLVVGAVAYVLLQQAGGTEGSGGARDGDDALAVLRERYARGEIDDEEFERRRRQLEFDGG